MVASSISTIISSTPSSLPNPSSSSSIYSFSSNSLSILGFSRFYRPNPRTHTPQSYSGPPKAVFFNQPMSSDGSEAEQFMDNNTVADFMRFKNGSGNSQLQTAVVSYRKKFPWSLLQPFLQVSSDSVYLCFCGFLMFMVLILTFFFFGIGVLICVEMIVQVDLVSTIHIADKE